MIKITSFIFLEEVAILNGKINHADTTQVPLHFITVMMASDMGQDLPLITRNNK